MTSAQLIAEPQDTNPPLRWGAYALGLILLCLTIGGCVADDPQLETLTHWQYREGFQQEWLKGDSEGEWKNIKLPHNFSGSPPITGDERKQWITLRTPIPPRYKPLVQNGQALALYAGRVLDVSYYYINEYKFGQLGSAQPYQDGAMRPFLEEIPLRRMKADTSNYLHIVLFSNGRYALKTLDEMKLGPSKNVFRRFWYLEIHYYGIFIFFLTAASYHILLYFYRPAETYNLYYAFFSLAVYLHWYVDNSLTQDLFYGEYVELHRKTVHFLFILTMPSLICFLTLFFENRYSRPAKYYLFICILLAVIPLPGPLWLMRICRYIWFALFPWAGFYALYYLFLRVKQRDKLAYYMAGGLVFIISAACNDILFSLGWINTRPIVGYSMFVFTGGIAGLMAARFFRVIQLVEELNLFLEKKVSERTSKLRNSLRAMVRLKQKQDADYFLTSLLIKPLAQCLIGSETINLTVLTHQKKQFRFKKHRGDIGGDISIAEKIQLNGENYIAFINGDAMGKSLQGAGGAIVMGTVFRSIIARSRINAEDSSRVPEEWLRDSYKELQYIYEAFDGCMTATAFIGLLDESQGLLFYLNVEHPWTVLFRDGQADFLDRDTGSRKFGAMLPAGGLRINQCRLEPGDVIIAGTDGRDDLSVPSNSNKISHLHVEPEDFLTHVTQGQGNLEKIWASLSNTGEINDDLSLLRIQFLHRKK